ncbi:DUF2871 domain-containing protein [Staphylococcus massiliensis]|uniref:DUF2871 domain-containing protein n=1 Tax=Staphylococcus massiliensis S46 TaxID=1229783 RepID=K9B8I3_9STAP|nr:DUF2871 domain-containing protein [Staphylococcus massiliensis]EKU50075.1 hypothetical protein C273_02363 [Staphylococcus massiliensis S46]MCG3402219.1 DUF2871 domain-containing protein [Staphylococcus massiliensis]MCG3412814.1 DUF2871 domain-containing protein [Staphylococcus massiliensis]PNZ99654.1 DUF2871 domain-containing protein [Staphylococcus massiliensis CCUG 55927]
MLKKFAFSSAFYTVLGLLAGLFYREFSKGENFEGYSQLNVTHVHLLVLGTVMFLIFLLLEKVFKLSKHSKGATKAFFWIYHLGLLVTVAMQFVNGIMTMKGLEASPAIAGISGLGHIFLSLAFIFFFVSLFKSLKHDKQ